MARDKGESNAKDIKTSNKKVFILNRINSRVLIMLLVFLVVAAILVSIYNSKDIRRTYEQNFTERVLLTNAIMADFISVEDVKIYVDLLTALNKDEDFKQRQVQYYNDRNKYWEISQDHAEYQAITKRMADFKKETESLKDERYWQIITELQRLTELSNSAYLYVMADTGLKTDDGDILYSFIFANDDEKLTDDEEKNLETIDFDGIGTSDISLDNILTVYNTKKQMEKVAYYNDVYGELYFAYAPIIDENGEVIAVFGTDLDLGDMNSYIKSRTLISNIIILAVFVVIIVFIFLYLHFGIITPLKQLTGTANRLAEGNIYAKPSSSTLKQRSEIGVLAQAINDMSTVYQDMVKDSKDLFAAAKIGRLDYRNDVSRFKGDIQDFIIQTNDTLDATTLYLNNIPESIFIINKDLQIYFKNNTFSHCFKDMTGEEFICNVFKNNDSIKETSSREILMQHLKSTDQNEAGIQMWQKDRCYSVLFREITLTDNPDNSILVIAVDITDLVNEKERAQAAATAKSDFLSRMSHEMRTPMNAIIGMSKIAENSDDLSKLRYCLSNINVSANHLLGIINDVLDMSKIEAGKFELEYLPLNLEKLLMNVCNLVIDNMEKKHQRFNVILQKNLELNYIGDGLRLSQVITNLLSNAVKFTPQDGKITLSVEKIAQNESINTLRFSVSDTGIGLSENQAAKLFNAFEQADGSVTRKYGGTGLGLAISKNIVEKMGGKIWVLSEEGKGATFIFEINLKRNKHQNTVIFDKIRPEDLKILVVENDADALNQFLCITEGFGIVADTASTAKDAIKLVENSFKRKYDIIFLACDLPDANALEVVQSLSGKIDKNTVIVITTFLQWRIIENEALKHDVSRYITKPFFPSSILDSINNTIGTTLKSLDIKTSDTMPTSDFSDIQILLAEDVEINREILMALLEDTKIKIDCAENGLIALNKFKANPKKYDRIIMDIQMPEMDGFEATKSIRALKNKKAKAIPIIAVTANAFKEDIDRCLAAGMNDHLAKPIDEKLVIQKIAKYVKKS